MKNLIQKIRNLKRLGSITMLGTLMLMCGSVSAHVTLMSPNGGEILLSGDQAIIRWSLQIPHDGLNWDIEYSITGAAGPWLEVAIDLDYGNPSMGSIHQYQWDVPNTPSNQVRIRVRQDNVGFDYEDSSDMDFTIRSGIDNAIIAIPTMTPLGLLLLCLLISAAVVLRHIDSKH